MPNELMLQHKYPNAPHFKVCGAWFLRAPCEKCGGSIISAIGATEVNCNCDSPKEVRIHVGNPHPCEPRSEKRYNGGPIKIDDLVINYHK